MEDDARRIFRIEDAIEPNVRCIQGKMHKLSAVYVKKMMCGRRRGVEE
jgi:hypothetical protein